MIINEHNKQTLLEGDNISFYQVKDSQKEWWNKLTQNKVTKTIHRDPKFPKHRTEEITLDDKIKVTKLKEVFPNISDVYRQQFNIDKTIKDVKKIQAQFDQHDQFTSLIIVYMDKEKELFNRACIPHIETNEVDNKKHITHEFKTSYVNIIQGNKEETIVYKYIQNIQLIKEEHEMIIHIYLMNGLYSTYRHENIIDKNPIEEIYKNIHNKLSALY